MSTSPVRVADGVDVDLDGVGEEAVDQHRPLGRQPALATEAAEAGQLLHRRRQLVDVVDDLHRPAARARSSAARAPGKPIASTIASASSRSVAVPPGGCGMCSSSHSAFHFSRSSARSIDAGAVPAIELDGDQRGELERRLAAERHDHLGRASRRTARVSAAITWCTSSLVSGSK